MRDGQRDLGIRFSVRNDDPPASDAGLVNGKAVIKTAALSIGPHSLTAVYLGDGNDRGSRSAIVSVTIN